MKIGIETVCGFTEEMFRVSDADFGFLTSLNDLQAKNYLQRVTRYGLNPAEAVPRLYLDELFSRDTLEWLRSWETPFRHCGARTLPGQIRCFTVGPELNAAAIPKRLPCKKGQ